MRPPSFLLNPVVAPRRVSPPKLSCAPVQNECTGPWAWQIHQAPLSPRFHPRVLHALKADFVFYFAGKSRTYNRRQDPASFIRGSNSHDGMPWNTGDTAGGTGCTIRAYFCCLLLAVPQKTTNCVNNAVFGLPPDPRAH